MLPLKMQVLTADVIRRHGGAAEYAWDDAGPSYPCDAQPVEATKKASLHMMEIDASYTLFWDPAAVAIDADARIKINGEVFKLASAKQTTIQRPGWPAKAFIVEARL